MLSQILAGTREPILVIDIANPNWRVVFYNPAMLRLLNLKPGEVSGQDARPLLFRAAGAAAVDAVMRCDDDCPSVKFDGKFLSAGSADVLLQGQVLKLAGGADIRGVFMQAREPSSEQSPKVDKESSSITLRMIETDQTTGFYKKEAWLEILERDAAIASREQSWVAVLVIRVDALASYADTFGRHAKDAALKRIAHTIRRRLKRVGDTAARVSEDTIAVLVHGSNAAQAMDFAESIAGEIKELAIHHPKSPVAGHITATVSATAGVPGANGGGKDLLSKALAHLPGS